MDANQIIQIVSTVGFPVLACIALGFYVKTQTDSYRSDVRELQHEHKEEISKVTEALNNNTLALQKLVDKIDRMKEN